MNSRQPNSKITPHFGSGWTVLKLNALEDYLRFYATALKGRFKLCYIDAFAGCGNVIIKDGSEIEGSPIRALRYPFDKYYFFDTNPELLNELKSKIDVAPHAKNIKFRCGNCNRFLSSIDKIPWSKNKWRGVIFLDPYAMSLGWECLNRISKTGVFDVWYLFPISAVTRNLPNDARIALANKKKLDFIFGENDWQEKIYHESQQLTLFGDKNLEKTDTDGLKKYILSRLSSTFPTVSNKAALLTNELNSPLFLLCFAGSNKNPTAKKLSLKGADYILSHIQD